MIALNENKYISNTYNYLVNFETVYILDIVGFLLLGIVQIAYSTSNSNKVKSRKLLISGCGFIFWVILRIIWQFIVIQTENDNALDNSLDFFLVSTFGFTVGLLFLISIIEKYPNGKLMVVFYAIMNQNSSIYIFLFLHTSFDFDNRWNKILKDWLSYHSKLIFSPIIAIIAFSFLLLDFTGKTNIEYNNKSSKNI